MKSFIVKIIVYSPLDFINKCQLQGVWFRGLSLNVDHLGGMCGWLLFSCWCCRLYDFLLISCVSRVQPLRSAGSNFCLHVRTESLTCSEARLCIWLLADHLPYQSSDLFYASGVKMSSKPIVVSLKAGPVHIVVSIKQKFLVP